MNVTCADCASIFRVDPAKVPAAGVVARCSVCGAVISVQTPTEATPVRATAPGPELVAPNRAGGVPPRVPPAAVEPARATPEDASEGAESIAARSAPRITPRGTAPASPGPGGEGPAQPRRFNPFLSNDPSQKARRLARALVSDLVAYNPQKREEGLRAGNLKELFREEIRKSWTEYVEQVGAPIAEGTTHFQDALNDVLAGGRKMF